jgi:secreted trypsin-like serine protease
MKLARIVPAFLAALLLLLASTPAAAITYGEPDGEGHPYVGTIFVDMPEGRYWICSGTLLSPTVFLTAGHCTDLMEELGGPATVSFNSVLRGAPVTRHRVAQVVTGPDFYIGATLPTHGDIGVLVLAAPVYLDEYGVLPEAGLLDTLSTQRGLQDLSVTLVGYGTLGPEHPDGGGKPDLAVDYHRNTTTATLLNLRSHMTDGENIQISGNPGQDRGGLCFGDSGGPVLLGDSNIVVGVNSFVFNGNCAGTAFAYRTDIAAARSFLSSFVALP